MRTQGGFLAVLTIFCLGLFLLPNKLIALDSQLLINEVQISGAGGTQEDFVEFYNPTSEAINLKGYRLVKRTKTGTNDTSIKSWTSDEFIAAGGYYLWANSNNGYANTIGADASTTQTIAADNGIALRYGKTDEGEIVDSLGWGECANTFIEGAVFAQNPEAGQSLERINFSDTSNNANDFNINNSPSPQSSNGSSQADSSFCGNGQKEDGEECDDGNNTNSDGCDSACAIEANDTLISTTTTISEIEIKETASFRWGDVVINEFVSDPSDEDTEWIELFNTSYKQIDLSDWTISDGSGAKTKLSGKLGTNGEDRFSIVDKPAGSLNNAGDLVVLKYKDGVIDKVVYGNWDDGSKDSNAPVAGDPLAVARKTDGYNTGNNKNDFAVTATLTKGKSNVITANDTNSDTETGVCSSQQEIVISEIFPNPAGMEDESKEFIEIYNQSGSNIDLSGWILGDSSQKKYEFKQSRIIKAGEFLVIDREASGLALNNDEDEISIYQPDCERPSKTIKYADAKEGWSYNDTKYTEDKASSTRHKWVWSNKITPGQFNKMLVANEPPVVAFSAPAEVEIGQPVIFDSSDTIDESTSSLKYHWDFGDGATSTLINPEHTYFKIGSPKIKLTVTDGQNEASKAKTIKVVKKGLALVKGASTNETKKTTKKTTTAKKTNSKKIVYKTASVSLEKVKSLAKGDRVKVEGVVAVLPNIFSSQYFYIVGSGGVQVYNYKKEFPALQVGDTVSVSGEISTVSGEQRIKTSSKDDIKIIKNDKAPKPEILACENVNEEAVGSLVSVAGEVTEKKGYTVFLDDGTNEAQIYLKKNTGLSSGDFTEGDKIEVRGIVSQSGTNLRIMPRSRDDIVKQSNSNNEILGEVASSGEWQLAARDKNKEVLKYFLAVAIFVTLGSLVFAVRKIK